MTLKERVQVRAEQERRESEKRNYDYMGQLVNPLTHQIMSVAVDEGKFYKVESTSCMIAFVPLKRYPIEYSERLNEYEILVELESEYSDLHEQCVLEYAYRTREKWRAVEKIVEHLETYWHYPTGAEVSVPEEMEQKVVQMAKVYFEKGARLAINGKPVFAAEE